MGLFDWMKSPEERLLNLMVEQAGKPGFSVSYSPQGHLLTLRFGDYSLEPQRVQAIELARKVDDKFRAAMSHEGNVTVSTVTFGAPVSADLVEKYNERLEQAGKDKYILATELDEQELDKPVNSFAQLLSGSAKEKLIFDYDKDRSMLLIRQEQGGKALTRGETAFLMKLGKTVQTKKGISILVDEKALAQSYAKTVSDMGGNIAEVDLAQLIPSLAEEKEKQQRVPDYIAVLRDMKKADPMAWNALARKEGEHAMRIVFKTEDLRDTFVAALPPNTRHVNAAVPAEVTKALAAKGLAAEEAQMLIVNTQDVVDQIRAQFVRPRETGK